MITIDTPVDRQKQRWNNGSSAVQLMTSIYLAQYVTYGLQSAGYEVVCMEARQVKAVLSAMRTKPRYPNSGLKPENIRQKMSGKTVVETVV